MHFKTLPKLAPGDAVAVLSPSFAAPGRWPNVFELGLRRIREDFGLRPVEYPTTRKLGAAGEERAKDILAAFQDPEIKGVIAALGGDDQVTYIWKYLGKFSQIFQDNPKPFFGYSDNTHFINFLWLNGVPAFYGGSVFTEFAMQGGMDAFTVHYLRKAMFEHGDVELTASPIFNDEGLDWDNETALGKRRRYQPNEGWDWDGSQSAEGTAWGGCLESLDELLRHAVPIPSLAEFEQIILLVETSEEIPSADYVFRVLRAFGERGILVRIRGVLVGRPKAWEFHRRNSDDQKAQYKKEQKEAVIRAVRAYNPTIPIVQNLDFGHTAPQIPMPIGQTVKINARTQTLTAAF